MPKYTRRAPTIDIFPKPPRLPRNTFARLPHLPVWAQTPGETNKDLFQRRYNVVRARFPKITKPEGKVYLWLQDHFKDDGGQHNWAYTPSLAHNYRQGGIEVDFLIYGPRIVWQVQGEHFHFGNPSVEAQDRIELTALEQEGYTVVNLLESMINQDVNRVCTEALQGNQLYDDSIVSAGFTPFVGNPGADRGRLI